MRRRRKNWLSFSPKCKVAAVGVGTSTPTNLPPLTPLVVATGIEDKDTDSGLVFKRQRVGNVEAPSHKATGGHAPSFRDNPPNTSSPRDLIVHEGGGGGGEGP